MAKKREWVVNLEKAERMVQDITEANHLMKQLLEVLGDYDQEEFESKGLVEKSTYVYSKIFDRYVTEVSRAFKE